ncbi:TIGR03086 family metal-binding protein [Umezawaea endophytica]|uniref:TIGR03086 family metal-binding protein n=1 Tax=Umezawaea endophytica TaxID=1654476 RepID=A0A9X2VTQ5_9PSEU|nr:TIGR03086 family metal-binding protein [Umezawaea endophytica]MCS7481959.1 TIGR03086 family metal-binding protein [Umezawaea endophytica]
MTDLIDFSPAVRRLATLLAGVTDAQLTARTPCTEYTVGDLIDHIDNFAQAFTAAATKDFGDQTTAAPAPGAANLGPDWRTRVPARLEALAAAWAEPTAWDGDTQAGGVTLPAAVMGRFALDEVVVHGWDLARATDQPFTCDQPSLDVLEPLVTPQPNGDPSGPFGPAVPIPADAPQLDRVIAYTGRDPRWTAA